MILGTKIRRIFVQHHIDVSKVNMTITNGAARLTGVVVRDDGDEVHPSVMTVVDQKVEGIHGLRRINYEFDNLIHTGDAWVHIGKTRSGKENDRAEDMLAALRIRQIFVGFRLDASLLNITVTNGVARIYGKIQTESGEDATPTILSAADDKILKVKGIRRCNYEFENMMRSGEVWIPINRRRRRDRREAGGRVDG